MKISFVLAIIPCVAAVLGGNRGTNLNAGASSSHRHLRNTRTIAKKANKGMIVSTIPPDFGK